MTAPVPLWSTPGPSCATSKSNIRQLLVVLFSAAICCSSKESSAEVGTILSVSSDTRFRGYSISDGRPTVSALVSYDGHNGYYGTLLGTAQIGSNGKLRPSSVEANAGRTRRVSSEVTLDFGIDHADYALPLSVGPGKSYTAVYAGIAYKSLSSRVFFSPHYFGAGDTTFYYELNAVLHPVAHWSLSGHLGRLFVLTSPRRYPPQEDEYDWQVGATRSIGRMSVQAALTRGSSGNDRYPRNASAKVELLLGLAYAL